MKIKFCVLIAFIQKYVVVSSVYSRPRFTDSHLVGTLCLNEQFDCFLKFAHHLRASCGDPWFTQLRYLTQLRDDELSRLSQGLSQGYRINK